MYWQKYSERSIWSLWSFIFCNRIVCFSKSKRLTRRSSNSKTRWLARYCIAAKILKWHLKRRGFTASSDGIRLSSYSIIFKFRHRSTWSTAESCISLAVSNHSNSSTWSSFVAAISISITGLISWARHLMSKWWNAISAHFERNFSLILWSVAD